MGQYLASSGVLRESSNSANRLRRLESAAGEAAAVDEAATDGVSIDEAVFSDGGAGLFLASAGVLGASSNCTYRLRRLESAAVEAVAVFSQGMSVADARRSRSLVTRAEGASGEAAIAAGSALEFAAIGGGLSLGAASRSAQPVQKTSAKTSGRKPRAVSPRALRSVMCAEFLCRNRTSVSGRTAGMLRQYGFI